MTKFNFFVNGIIRAGDEADAKTFLQELVADVSVHTSLPVGVNWNQ